MLFRSWWQAICVAAEQLDFMRIKLPLKNSDSAHRTLTWQRKARGTKASEVLTLRIPIRWIKTDPRLNIEVDVNVNSSLESAGHRVALFGRLIDEHSIKALLQ